MARRPWTHDELVAGVRSGDRRAVARAISLVESRGNGAMALLQELYPDTGSTFTLGITGPPGVGKSSLIGALITHVRRLGLTVGVISIDPSSPFSRGALLGDRIRLADHFLDPGVFIRSMGSRGHLGGVAEATLQSLLLLDAAGTDVVFLETVGAGQSEVEVMSVADEVVLVLMPGSGDSVQALKAGIMEIPDVIAVNKMDQPGAKALQNDIRGVIALDPNAAWRPPIVLTEAVRGEGVDALWEAIVECRDALEADGRLEQRRRDNLAGEVIAAATARARNEIERTIEEDAAVAELVAAVQRREVDPLTAADRIASSVLREAPS
jgi:LAO/AO transport system kinase